MNPRRPGVLGGHPGGWLLHTGSTSLSQAKWGPFLEGVPGPPTYTSKYYEATFSRIVAIAPFCRGRIWSYETSKEYTVEDLDPEKKIRTLFICDPA